MAEDPWSDFMVAPQGAQDWSEFNLGNPVQAQQPYSLGPISAIPELGARGINYLAQMLPESIRPAPRQPQPLQPLNLPGIGQPSATQMLGHLADSVQGAVTLPGDVYAGKVDPLSDEAIKRATDLAAISPLSGMPLAAQRAATPALSPQAIKDAASASYDAVRQRVKGIDLGVPGVKTDAMYGLTGAAKGTTEYPFSAAVADHMQAAVKSRDVGELLSPETQRLINEAGKAKEMSQLVHVREALGETVRDGGKDGLAASLARDALDEALGPQISSILRTADRDYAIAYKALKDEQTLADATQKASTFQFGVPEGTKIKQAFRPMLEKGRGEKLEELTPATYAATQRVVNPGWGPGMLEKMGWFDPTTRAGLMTNLLSLPAAPFTLGLKHAFIPAAGYGARMAYDRLMRNRARAVSEARRSEAPATLAQPGYFGGGVIGMPQMSAPSLGVLPAMDLPPPPVQRLLGPPLRRNGL